MANIRSQMKRNRQTATRTARNRSIRSELRTRTRKALEAAQAGDAPAAAKALSQTQKSIDKATAKGVLHPNTAARRKSKLARQVREQLGG